MKINELIKSFTIYITNEEESFLNSFDGTAPIEQFSEREQVIIENLIRKSLISKIRNNNSFVIRKND